MEYIEEILTFLSWPLVIVVSYYLSKYALRKFDKFLPEADDE
ncbi:MAG: hypothetical protein U9N86_07515 [Bacteroidota bacterium]|nr:hypothetical protein [Bacteroidota bacterium]